jgi:hypothetical protein
MEEKTTEEQNFRINIKTTSKGYAYFEATIRSNNPEEAQSRLNEAVLMAQEKCKQINEVLQND